MAGDEPEKGDKVSWNWGGGAPGGKVAEKKTQGEIAITSKRGNKIKKNASPDNPAVHIERSGNDVVKKASELNVEEKASAGDKRKHDEVQKDDDKEAATDKKDEKEEEGPIVKNDQGKDVKPGGKEANKKQKKEKEDKAKKQEEKKEEKKEKEKEEKQTNGDKQPAPAKKAGRPKKTETSSSGTSSSTTKAKKKEAKPRNTEGVSGRTRSQAK